MNMRNIVSRNLRKEKLNDFLQIYTVCLVKFLHYYQIINLCLII